VIHADSPLNVILAALLPATKTHPLESLRAKTNRPDSIQAPAGEELVFMARATGFQIYVCRPDADGKLAWTLKAPEAELFDARR
jgi:hypothetical protein